MRIFKRVERHSVRPSKTKSSTRAELCLGVILLGNLTFVSVSYGVVAAEFTGPYRDSYAVSSAETSIGQSFRAQAGGKLTSMELAVHDRGGAFDVKFSLLNMTAGGPGSQLAEVIVPSSAIPDSGTSFFSIDFSSFNVSLTEGNDYVAAVQILLGTTTDQVRWVVGLGDSPYSSGRAFLNQSGTWNTSNFLSDLDLGFRVSVIPEPGTVGLISFAGAIGLGFARPRKFRSGAGRG